jgi:hypothetical protein
MDFFLIDIQKLAMEMPYWKTMRNAILHEEYSTVYFMHWKWTIPEKYNVFCLPKLYICCLHKVIFYLPWSLISLVIMRLAIQPFNMLHRLWNWTAFQLMEISPEKFFLILILLVTVIYIVKPVMTIIITFDFHIVLWRLNFELLFCWNSETNSSIVVSLHPSFSPICGKIHVHVYGHS